MSADQSVSDVDEKEEEAQRVELAISEHEEEVVWVSNEQLYSNFTVGLKQYSL